MNGQLFTQDFLSRGIVSSPVWTALPEAQLVDAFIDALRSVYGPYSASSTLNEAITESEIIVKVLAQLAWSDLWLPQVTASGTRREDVPDFLLFPDEVAKAHSLKEKRDHRQYRMARLDALFFHLYRIKREDAAYILDTFPIVREQDEKAHGRFLTKELVLAYLNAVEAGDLKTTVSV